MRELLEVLTSIRSSGDARGVQRHQGHRVPRLDHKNPVPSSRRCHAHVRMRGSPRAHLDDLWEAINSSRSSCGAESARRSRAAAVRAYRIVKSRCQTISGVASETMRATTAGGLPLGRMLERDDGPAGSQRPLRPYHARTAERQSPRQRFSSLGRRPQLLAAFEAYVKAYNGSWTPRRCWVPAARA